MDKPVNYTREAFLHPLNLAMLIAAFTTAFFVSGSEPLMNTILAISIAVELIYLGTVPRTARFQKYINLRLFKERNSKFDERRIFGALSESSQKRFLVLKHISGLIRDNFSKMNYASQGLLDNLNTRIETLLTSYMLLLENYERYQFYLNNTTEERLAGEIESTEKEIKDSRSPRLVKVLNRRLDILNKRREKYGVAREKYLISDSQLKTIEDTIRYIYEKSMTMTNLTEIERQVDTLLMDLEDSETVFNEMQGEYNDVPEYLSELRKLEQEMEQTDNLFDHEATREKN